MKPSISMKTNYLGLELKNPLVPSASPLSRNLDTTKRLEDAGAAAIVMYSLFEEEIRHQDEMLDKYFHDQSINLAETDGFRDLPDDFNTEIDDYLLHIERLKEALDIPVVASLNANTLSGWVEHATELEKAGADALELNIYHLPGSVSETSADVEELYVNALRAVKKQLTIPVAMKLSPQFSSIPHLVNRLQQGGADGVALFNRFYQPSIDLFSLNVTPELHLSTSTESLLSMRWIAILRDQVDLTLAATSGVHTSQDVLRLLLAGANVVHLCSALLSNGPDYLSQLLQEIQAWMDDKEYESIEQLKGSVSSTKSADPGAYARANYLQVLRSWV